MKETCSTVYLAICQKLETIKPEYFEMTRKQCYIQGRRQWGTSGAWAPHLKSVPLHFTFGPPVAAYIQYCILNMCPPFWFLSPPLLNPGDGPGYIS